ncbi:MAG: bifunctional (p)ppGpp synthetase/guanosine-3',5'-bis(diphosphate) 3'-pyrophosphohydrolase [Acidobacteriota bacterium]
MINIASMVGIEDIVAKVQKHHPTDDMGFLRRAYDFSAREHEGQIRRSGEPFLNHPMAVADILAEMKLDVVCVSVGLLHDIVEDTQTPIERIEQNFGKDIAHIVDGVTKISKYQFDSKEEQQAENFRKMFLAMVDDIRVVLVKLADRLHNMRTLHYLSEEKRRRIAKETLEIYAPIAHRLGMGKLRGELEDLAFSHLEPEAYEEIKKQIESKRKVKQEILEEVKEVISQRLQEHEIPCSVESRIKRIYSVYQKIKRQRIPIEQVYDLLAVRIITGTVRDCYGSLGIIHNIWRPVPGRIKDFIAIPRPNMYQSLHTSVIGPHGQPFEVQIRTTEMHRVAEEGIAAHWKYKTGRAVDEKDDQRFVWLRQLVEWQQEMQDPNDFLSTLKIDLYPEEVYTFTPKGKVIILPRDASPVDFAYAIHTEVGHTCVGAKINGRIIPLKSRLKNGDVVEIQTQPGHTPSRDWLSSVKTSKARNKIRHFINVSQREHSIEIGKKILEKEARKFKVNLKKLTEEGTLLKVAPEYGCTKLEDLYSGLGFGKISARILLSKVVPAAQMEEVEERVSRFTSAVKKVFGISSDAAIKVKDVDDLLVYRAKCCNPIRGEEIVGYITRGKGVAVHARRCPNVGNLLYEADRKIHVEWTNGSSDHSYAVKLSISVDDRQGMLAEITSTISEIKTNIKNIEAQSFEDHRGLIHVTIEIADLKHLERAVSSLKKIKGVNEVAWQ